MTLESDEVQRACRVQGRVQGVGFRWWTRETARSLGLAGTVRNLPDGSVEVHARGPADGVAELGKRLRDGPAFARVDRVEARASRVPLGPGFEVTR